jgi:hypothetical protein
MVKETPHSTFRTQLFFGTADEAIAYAYDGFDAIAAVAEFLTKAAYVYIERACVAEVLITPNVIEKLLACCYAT